MSAVTLESLKADFEAKKRKLIKTYGLQTTHRWSDYRMFDHRNDLEDPALEDFCQIRITGFDMSKDGIDFECKAAAILLDVAEKHGLQAAMLFKLSDGAIDPRISEVR